MVALIHDSGWTRTPQWPAAARAGDVGFLLVAVYPSWMSGLSWRPGSAWSRLRQWQMLAIGSFARTVAVYQAAPGARLSESPNYASQRLVVFTDTSGVGVTRAGVGAVQARPFGGVFTVGAQASAGDGAGMVVLPGEDPFGFGVRGAWDASTAGGLLGDLDWDGSRTVAIELLPPAGPGAPVLLAPGNGDEVTNSGDVVHEWQHRPVVPGGFQDAYQLRVLMDGDERYWNASTGALVAGETTNAATVESAAIPAGLYTANAPHGWQVRTREGVDGRWSEWSGTDSFTPVTPPTADLFGPDVFHDDLSPVVAWDSSTPRGTQTAFRVQLAHFGSIVYDSGVQPGRASEWQVPPLEWIQGGLYQRRVQVQQTGGSWSSWVTRDFTITWTEPATPGVEVWSGADGVLVQVVADAGLVVDLERITGEGLWVRVDSFTMPSDGAVTVTDVRAPLGRVVAYRARAVNELDGQRLVSGWGLSGQVANRSRWSYLFAARAPLSTWVRCYIRQDGPHRPVRATQVTDPMGDEWPRFSYGTRRGRSGTLVLHAFTQEDRDHLVELLYAGEPLGVRFPGEAEDAGPGYRDGGELIFGVAGEVEVARVTTGPLQRREITVPWRESAPVEPTGHTGAPIMHRFGGPAGAGPFSDNDETDMEVPA